MAKVTGPLFSLSASGKIGDAMVHFGWKGLNVVRGWVKPVNKHSPDQGDARLMLGGLGRAMKAVVKDSACYADLVTLSETPETWNSAFVKYGILNIFTSAVLCNAEITAYGSNNAKTYLDSLAVALGINALDNVDAGIVNPMTGGFMLYMIARIAIAIKVEKPTLFARAPYTTALASWGEATVNDFAVDIATPV